MPNYTRIPTSPPTTQERVSRLNWNDSVATRAPRGYECPRCGHFHPSNNICTMPSAPERTDFVSYEEPRRDFWARYYHQSDQSRRLGHQRARPAPRRRRRFEDILRESAETPASAPVPSPEVPPVPIERLMQDWERDIFATYDSVRLHSTPPAPPPPPPPISATEAIMREQMAQMRRNEQAFRESYERSMRQAAQGRQNTIILDDVDPF